MGYSINSRFRGTLLGTAIGEMLGKSGTGNSDSQIINLVVLGIKTLIKQGRLDSENWRRAFLSQNTELQAAHAIMTTLPVALFYHENEILLRQNVQLALLALGQEELESQDGALVVCYALAKAVQTKPSRVELIFQTTAFLGKSPTLVAQKLNQVRILLEENAGLERAIAVLSKPEPLSSQIALAFYCFLSTLEDFQLSTKRAAKEIAQPQFTSALTGSLSGAYNGISGIPVVLQMPLFYTEAKSVTPTSVTTAAEMLRLCDVLLAVWSGVYEQAHPQAALNRIAAVAALERLKRVEVVNFFAPFL